MVRKEIHREVFFVCTRAPVSFPRSAHSLVNAFIECVVNWMTAEAVQETMRTSGPILRTASQKPAENMEP